MSHRVRWVIVLALCLVAALTAARSQAANQVRLKPDATTVIAAQTAKSDPWQFPSDDDDKPPTFAQIVRGQAVDLTLLTAFVALTLVGFYRKSETLKTITLVASVVYIGF